MRIGAKSSPYLPPLITGIAIVFFSTAGLGRMMGWGSNMPADGQMAAVSTSQAPAGPRCRECGVIVAVREIERHDYAAGPGAPGGATAGSGNGTSMTTASRHEVTVRMADGSIRVDYPASPGSWRSGERVILIGGVSPSQP